MEKCPKDYHCPLKIPIPELLGVTERLLGGGTLNQRNILGLIQTELIIQEFLCSNGAPLSLRGIRQLLSELTSAGLIEPTFLHVLKSIGTPGSARARWIPVNQLTKDRVFR